MPEMDIGFYVWAPPPGEPTKTPNPVPIDALWYNAMFVPFVKIRVGQLNSEQSRPPGTDRFDTDFPVETFENLVIRLGEWWSYLFGNPVDDDPLNPRTHIYPNANRPVALFFQQWGVRGVTTGTGEYTVPALMQNDGDRVGAGSKPPPASNRGSIYAGVGAEACSQFIDDLLETWEESGPRDMMIESLLWDLEESISVNWVINEVDGDGDPKGWLYWAINDDRYGDDPMIPGERIIDDVGARAPRTLKYVWEQEAWPRFDVNTKHLDEAQRWVAPINQPIVRFMFTLGVRAFDWRLHETLYSKFKEWEFSDAPGVKPWADLTAGNYAVVTAHETEPVNSVADMMPWLTRFTPDWLWADFSVPLLYPTRRHIGTGDNVMDIYPMWGKGHWSAGEFMHWSVNRRLHQTAQGNRWSKEIFPVILSPGRTFSDNTGVIYTMTDEDFEILLDAAYAYGARRFWVFTGDLGAGRADPIPPDPITHKTVWQRIGEAFDALNTRTKNPARRRRGRWPNKIE